MAGQDVQARSCIGLKLGALASPSNGAAVPLHLCTNAARRPAWYPGARSVCQAHRAPCPPGHGASQHPSPYSWTQGDKRNLALRGRCIPVDMEGLGVPSSDASPASQKAAPPSNVRRPALRRTLDIARWVNKSRGICSGAGGRPCGRPGFGLTYLGVGGNRTVAPNWADGTSRGVFRS